MYSLYGVLYVVLEGGREIAAGCGYSSPSPLGPINTTTTTTILGTGQGGKKFPVNCQSIR